MKIALIAVTGKGALLAAAIAQQRDNCDVFVKHGRTAVADTDGPYHEYHSLSQLTAAIFPNYQALVFIIATGIVVRVIAPHIVDKRSDPAVVVIDDCGQHAISLLSGHIGGANELTRSIAAQIGAVAVITTATDTAGLPAADVLAVKLGLKISSFPALKQINAAIANGHKVTFFLDGAVPHANVYQQQAAALQIEFDSLASLTTATCQAAIIITDQHIDTLPIPQLILRPPTLAVGVGCRAGATSAAILATITQACAQLGRSVDSIAVIGSTIVKQHEQGLLAAAEQLAAPIEFYQNSQLAAMIETYQLTISPFVYDKIGVGNVCEAAALLAGQSDRLLLTKTNQNGVTVAIAPAALMWSASGRAAWRT